MKTKFLYPLMALSAFLWISCSDDKDDTTDSVEIPVEDIEVNAQAELLSDQIDDIAAAVVTDESASAKQITANRIELPACLTVTTTFDGDKVTKVLDFGEGCQMANGVTYSGKLWVVYTWDNEMRQANIVVETEGFGMNDLLVSGRKEIVRTWPGAEETGFPASEVSTELTVTHGSGLNATVTGTTTREWVEGYGSGNWGDNVVLIGGNRTVTTYLNDAMLYAYEVKITDKLRREWSCRFIVSGELTLSRDGFTATLNYGSGDCDNKAMLTTPSGATKQIELR